MSHFFDGFLLLFGPYMDVSLGCCLDIRIADDRLNGLDIRSGVVQMYIKKLYRRSLFFIQFAWFL